jgi:hypothetical protein
LCFIEDDRVRSQFVHIAHVLERQFVAGQVEEFRRGIQFPPPRKQSVDHLRRKAGEFLDFGFPLVLHGSRRHHQHSRYPAAAAQHLRGCQGLHGFAQTHVVGDDNPSAAGCEDCATHLIGQQLRFQNSIRRVLAPAELCQKLLFEVEPFGDFVFPVDVFQHVAVNHSLQVGAAKSLDHLMKAPEMFFPEQPGRIEILAGQRLQSRRWSGG